VDSSATGYHASFFPGDGLVFAKGSTGTASTLAAANSSFTQTRQALLSADTGVIFSATINPINRAAAQVFFLVPSGGGQDSLRIVSESGRMVATLAVDTSGAFWSWNLRDPQNRTVPAGVYFFGTDALPAKTLLVLP
jgi:hypothetical protein